MKGEAEAALAEGRAQKKRNVELEQIILNLENKLREESAEGKSQREEAAAVARNLEAASNENRALKKSNAGLE